MVIDKHVVKAIAPCCYGFVIFLVTNVYMLWGVALPSSDTMALVDYDAVILPFRLAASTTMAIAPLVIFAIQLLSKPISAFIYKNVKF